MRIALTYNLKITGSPEEAEFDSPETIDALAASLARAGHDVERIEVSGPASRVIARLEALAPDLIFNTAEGHKGKTREAFYPALFDELGIPYTGSDPHTLCVTLDKALTKQIVAGHGVATPPGRLVNRATFPNGVSGVSGVSGVNGSNGALDGVELPVIVKPNFEGSSKGISGASSVCEDAGELAALVERELGRFEAGLLVERYLPGIDVACAFLDGVGADGVLDPIELVIDPPFAGLHNVYDYKLKNVKPDHVTVRPAILPPATLDRLKALTRQIVRALDLRDFARCEFRVTPSSILGEHDVQFLEVDALPSLEPGLGLFLAAKQRGLDYDGVIRAIVKSACVRRGLLPALESTPKKPRRSPIRVGLTFNVKRVDPNADDAEAEFDSPKTIQAIASAIESYGHTVLPMEANADLPHVLTAARPDVVFNIAEGVRGRGREAQVPALCELLGIPYSGSDPTTLSVCLDKGLTKQILRAAGIDTAEWQVLTTGREKLRAFRYPVIVKPNAEGTSKGISSASVVTDEAAARTAARALIDRYGQPALVEEYIAGRELTVGLLGERRPRVLPVLEMVFDGVLQYPVYGFEEKQSWDSTVRFDCPSQLTPALQRKVEKTVRDAFAALSCRDVARVDLRLTPEGAVYVIEVNPVPGLAPDFSDLCTCAKRAGMDHRTLIGEILSGCLKRWRDARGRPRNGAERIVSASATGAPPPNPAGASVGTGTDIPS